MTADDTVPPVPIKCDCGNLIYEEVYIQGLMLVHAGGGLWRELRGNCARCGVPFSWSVKDKQINRAIIAHKKLNAGGE